MDDGLISHEHAWWWGWFLTDGGIFNYRAIPSTEDCGRSLRWNLRYDSYPIILKLRDLIGSNHSIRIDTRTYDTNPTAQLTLYSVHLCRQATKLMRCHPSRKTFDLQFPQKMDHQFLSSLIRGISEGDGCWTMRYSGGDITFKITSANELFLQIIRSKINKYALQTNLDEGFIQSRNNNTCFDLLYYKKPLCNAIGEWMYDSEQIKTGMFMRKKHERFLLLNRLFMINQGMSRAEKSLIMREHYRMEQNDMKSILNELISMSKECNHETGARTCFSPNFYKFHN